MFKCKKCNSDCSGLSSEHGKFGCIYCHCRLTEEQVELNGEPPLEERRTA